MFYVSLVEAFFAVILPCGKRRIAPLMRVIEPKNAQRTTGVNQLIVSQGGQ
ncbi:MAG: hypothetical protein ACUVXA_10785 [Candidatus Jordarchaeum sp.]|uniref:hypothetical protein n=1 Tax=Candidatus Jordarchaeum sp. TaxID=2823881 RepID=UPI004049A181